MFILQIFLPSYPISSPENKIIEFPSLDLLDFQLVRANNLTKSSLGTFQRRDRVHN